MSKTLMPSPAMPNQPLGNQGGIPFGHSGRSATSSDGMVGRRIKALRLRNGLTQKQVAARVGVTGAQFHRYEVGTTRVAASRLLDIATVLGVRAEALMNDDAPREATRHQPGPAASNDLLELVEMFSSIADQRRRCALVSFARCLAAQSAATPDSSPAEAA
ncbi:helix-turn-helix domain-containing protein [Roseococcus sp. SYP-B2431]|uniref:helix-turn-helix domain-containing protein n=1 Tax=Roseococcus sp. SYP-B2431 TaxID=2496640 RepID=UPI0013F414E4|nr:helix-turn-helix transcriptional regulator [Roseococcus sp. SYP-B2431]